MPVRQLVVAAYDIASARRLKRALKLCTAYAGGGQKSVHECWVTGAERAALCKGLAKICRPDVDRWMVAGLTRRHAALALGVGQLAPPPKPLLFLG